MTEGIFFGLYEAAQFFGVSKQQISNWRARPSHGFPEPRWKLRMGPIWTRTQLEAWNPKRERKNNA